MIGDLEAKYIIKHIISGQTLESCVKNGSRIASTNKEVQNSEWALGRFTTLKAIDTSRLKAIFLVYFCGYLYADKNSYIGVCT